ncbi:MAG: acyl carrier protein [Elusimicrobia bacterium]|nr:acyl carrier protein [Elusimicrobiota bacterium]
MSAETTVERVRRCLRRCAPQAPEEALAPGAPLFDNKVLDSLTTVELALLLEREFGVRVRAADLSRERFGTVEAIARFVESRARTEP